MQADTLAIQSCYAKVLPGAAPVYSAFTRMTNFGSYCGQVAAPSTLMIDCPGSVGTIGRR